MPLGCSRARHNRSTLRPRGWANRSEGIEMMGKRSVVAASVIGLGLAVARPAGAAGFANTHLGGEYGNPTTTNATALYYNPAGIAFSEGNEIYGDGQLA